MKRRSCGYIVIVGILAFTYAIALRAQTLDNLSEDRMRHFLLNAKVVNSRSTGKGITSPYRLTLSDGTLVHDAAFQWVDETRTVMEFQNGRKEYNFRDCYKYSIAAYELAKLVGLEDMMPVTVERKWDGKWGALSWWLPAKMDEDTRLSKKIRPPNLEAWNRQMHKMRVFSQLVYDTDRNLGNVLISEDWHLWMIDFSRAFRLYTTLEEPRNLVRCDRRLLQKLRGLDAALLAERTKGLLNSAEIDGLMARRDRIVALFEGLAAKKGEDAVFYD